MCKNELNEDEGSTFVYQKASVRCAYNGKTERKGYIHFLTCTRGSKHFGFFFDAAGKQKLMGLRLTWYFLVSGRILER